MARRTLKEKLVQRILDEFSKKAPYNNSEELMLMALRIMQGVEGEERSLATNILERKLRKKEHNIVMFRAKKDR